MWSRFVILCGLLNASMATPSMPKKVSLAVKPTERGRSLEVSPGCTDAFPCGGSDNMCYRYQCGDMCTTIPCRSSPPPPSAASDAGNTASDAVSDAGNTASDAVSDAGNTASDAVSDAGNAASNAVSALSTDGPCKPLANVPFFKDGTCTCKASSSGNGLDVDCVAQVPAVNTKFGIHLDIEPCASTAYAELKYSFNGIETVLGRFETGKVHQIEIPGLSFMSVGLFLNFEVKGTAADFTVHTSLSLCQSGQCDENVPIVGSIIKGFGFPVQLLTFDDLSFGDVCPASSVTIPIVIGVIVVGLLFVALGVVRRKQAEKAKAAEPTITKNIEAADAEKPSIASSATSTCKSSSETSSIELGNPPVMSATNSGWPTVVAKLAEVGLDEFAPKFKEFGYDTMEAFDIESKEALGTIADQIGLKPGHKAKFVKKFLASVDKV